MNRLKLIAAGSLFAALLLVWGGVPFAGADSCNKDKDKEVKACEKACKKACPKMCPVKRHVPVLSESINKALEAIQADDKDAAVAELKKAQKMLADIKNDCRQAVDGCKKKAGYLNSTCPIMGAPIDPNKVTEELTREYKGGRVAFCCAGCPKMWDKLTDEQKQEKAGKVCDRSDKKGCRHKH